MSCRLRAFVQSLVFCNKRDGVIDDDEHEKRCVISADPVPASGAAQPAAATYSYILAGVTLLAWIVAQKCCVML